MEFLPKERILEFNDDDLEAIRKMYGLDKPGRMKEAVDILEEWVQRQNHFVNKDFSRRYLEATIISCKGSVERAKSRVDKMCTFRTLLPQYFVDFSCIDNFKQIFDCLTFAALPKKDQYQNRIVVAKPRGNKFYPLFTIELFQLIVLGGEYCKVHDYTDGFVYIIDYTEVDIMNLVKNLNPIDIRHGMSILMDGIGCNVRGIHKITTSKSIEMLVNIIKQVVSTKISGRIHVHKSIESLYDMVPREVLPVEYGGKERSLDQLDNEWKEVYWSEENKQYVRRMNASRTDESLRQADIFNEQYFGMPGTFRALSLD